MSTEAPSDELRIYFAASIRGGRDDAPLYRDIIEFLKTKGKVLTEHIGLPSLTAMGEEGKSDESIYQMDLAWLRTANVVIAEVTTPSLGVGYELGLAEALGIPILCIYRPAPDRSLSAMIRGNSGITTRDYSTLDEAKAHIETALAALPSLVKHKVSVESWLTLASM